MVINFSKIKIIYKVLFGNHKAFLFFDYVPLNGDSIKINDKIAVFQDVCEICHVNPRPVERIDCNKCYENSL